MLKSILKTIKKEKSNIQEVNERPAPDVPTSCMIEFNKKEQLDLTLYQVAVEEISDVFYISNFINKDEHEYFLGQIYLREKEWNNLQYSQRRVQKYGGDVTAQGLQNQQILPEFLEQFKVNLEGYLDLPINHVLVNEYEHGVGIMNHFDGPLYYGFVNIVSLGSYCVFTFTKQEQLIRLLIEPNSLLIFTNEAYSLWYHGIEYFDEDTILLQINENQIVCSNVKNFFETNLKQSLEEALINNQQDDVYVYDKNNQIIASLCNLENNEKYNKALIIKRNKRVSVTFRHVYPQPN